LEDTLKTRNYIFKLKYNIFKISIKNERVFNIFKVDIMI